jgi:hypothetical protein
MTLHQILRAGKVSSAQVESPERRLCQAAELQTAYAAHPAQPWSLQKHHGGLPRACGKNSCLLGVAVS